MLTSCVAELERHRLVSLSVHRSDRPTLLRQASCGCNSRRLHFSEQASTSDSGRQNASETATAKELAAHHSEGDPRQQAASSVMPRSTGATKSATDLLAQYPDFAVVVAVWPGLSETSRDDIMAMVNAPATLKNSNRRRRRSSS